MSEHTSQPASERHQLSDYARAIAEVNRTFYDQQAASFGRTRDQGWQGWEQLYPYIKNLADRQEPLTILDLACGNLRFERSLVQKLPKLALRCHACDMCTELLRRGYTTLAAMESFASSSVTVELHEHDLMNALIESYQQGKPLIDASVQQHFSWLPSLPALQGKKPVFISCFGFMHHIPTKQLRTFALTSLCEGLPSHSLVALSFWEFARNTTRAAKAQQAHEKALTNTVIAPDNTRYLEPNDYFLGWSHTEQATRFCHSFDPQELNELIEEVKGRAHLVDRFSADGKTGDLNEYLVLEVH